MLKKPILKKAEPAHGGEDRSDRAFYFQASMKKTAPALSNSRMEQIYKTQFDGTDRNLPNTSA